MPNNRRPSGKKTQKTGAGAGTVLLYAVIAGASVFGGMRAFDYYYRGHSNVFTSPSSPDSPAAPSAGPKVAAAAPGDHSSTRHRHRPGAKADGAATAGNPETQDAAPDGGGDKSPKSNAPKQPEIPVAALPDPAPMEDGHAPIPSPSRAAVPSGAGAPRAVPPVRVTPAPNGYSPGLIPEGKPILSPTAAPGAAAPAPIRPVPAIEITRGAGQRKEVALTFDAGADWRPVKKILTALADSGAHSTFFLTGEWVSKNPRSTRLIAGAGHELGNRSWSHPPFTKLSDDEIRSQLRRTEAIIEETAGRSTHPYFRPPLGDRDSRVREVVGSEGFFTVYWTLDSRDSVDKGITSDQIRDRVLSKITPGSIVLLHCGSEATADALPEILRGLKEKGLTPVPLSHLLEE